MAHTYIEQLATEEDGVSMLAPEEEGVSVPKDRSKFTKKYVLIGVALMVAGAVFATRMVVGQGSRANTDLVVSYSVGDYSWCGSFASCRTHGAKSRCEKSCKDSGKCTSDAAAECERKRTYGDKKNCKKALIGTDTGCQF